MKKIGKITRILGLVANVLVGLLTIASAFGGLVDPATTTIPALWAMTFPLWFFLVPVMLVVDLLTYKRLAFIPGFVMMACMGPALSFCPLHFSNSPEPGAPTFKFLTYNIHSGRYGYTEMSDSLFEVRRTSAPWPTDHNPMVSYLIRSDADIVCLQETERPMWEAANPAHITPEQADSMKRRFPYRFNGTGASILSRYPMERVEINIPHRKYEDYDAAFIDIDGVRTLVVSVHMASIGLMADDKELFIDLTDGEDTHNNIRRARHQIVAKLSAAFRHRAQQARLLAAALDSIGADNVIVAGDFNDIPGCYALRTIAKADGGLRDAYADAALGPTITFYLDRLYFRIDHVLYRGPFRPVHVDRGAEKLSDHYPIEVTFQLSDPIASSTGPSGNEAIQR